MSINPQVLIKLNQTKLPNCFRSSSRLQRSSIERCRNDGEELDVDAEKTGTSDGVDSRQLQQRPVLARRFRRRRRRRLWRASVRSP